MDFSSSKDRTSTGSRLLLQRTTNMAATSHEADELLGSQTAYSVNANFELGIDIGLLPCIAMKKHFGIYLNIHL